MKEIRMYLADLSSWYNSSTELDNIMECAESQGTVWSLQQFVEQFNNGEEPLCEMLADVNGDVVMKACLFDDSEFVCEIKENVFGEWSEK